MHFSAMDDDSTPVPEIDSRLKHIESQGLTPSQALGGSKPAGPWQAPTPEQLQSQLP